MFHLMDRQAKTAPSQYPRVLFHSIRSFQLLASLIVGGIMSFFIWHLTHDHWPTPWTFIWLSAASLFSIAALLVTIVMHCCLGLTPRFNLFVNGFLLLIWAWSWGLLTYYMSGTLQNLCDAEHWHEAAGIMVCRIYKALFTFTLVGLLSSAAAFVLDIYVRRQNTRLGIYRLHDIDTKHPDATRGPYTEGAQTYSSGGLDEPRESEAWEAPRPSMGPYSEQTEGEKQAQGYSVPANQFDYDTGYRGHNNAKLYDQ